MRGVVFFDHLDAGAAVLGDLVDVRAFEEAQADIGMAQGVGGPPVAVPVEFELVLAQDGVELLFVVGREDQIRGLRKSQFGFRAGVSASTLLATLAFGLCV